MLTLLKRLREERKKGHYGQFGYGIGTADTYVKTVRECVGSDVCYRYASSKSRSFDDVVRKASNVLTYQSEMMQQDVLTDVYNDVKGSKVKLYDGVELPKNTLMAFKHTLTTPRKDRDGDTLLSEGAEPDPNMLLIWQHVPTLPLGKFLRVEDQSNERLRALSCIVDMNELCHDAAVMVDNKMGRFSHGFRAIDFIERKTEKGSFDGFEVKRFEIMEESLVSIPSNVDAETEEVVLSLVEGRKLKSPVMREYGKHIREKRPKSVNVPKDIPGSGQSCGCGKGSSPTKTSDGSEKTEPAGTETTKTKTAKVKSSTKNLGTKTSSRKTKETTPQEGEALTVQSAMEFILNKASKKDRERFTDILLTMRTVEKRDDVDFLDELFA